MPSLLLSCNVIETILLLVETECLDKVKLFEKKYHTVIYAFIYTLTCAM